MIVHGDIRHLEMIRIIGQTHSTVHGDIRHLETADSSVNAPKECSWRHTPFRKNMKFGYAKELPSLLSGGKQSNNAQAQVAELEQQLANEKSVPKKAQLRKQITELQNGLTEQSQSNVSLNQPQKTTVENLSGEFKKIEESTNPIKKMALKGISSQILSGNRSEVEDVIKSLGITEGEIASIQPDPKNNPGPLQCAFKAHAVWRANLRLPLFQRL